MAAPQITSAIVSIPCRIFWAPDVGMRTPTSYLDTIKRLKAQTLHRQSHFGLCNVNAKIA